MLWSNWRLKNCNIVLTKLFRTFDCMIFFSKNIQCAISIFFAVFIFVLYILLCDGISQQSLRPLALPLAANWRNSNICVLWASVADRRTSISYNNGNCNVLSNLEWTEKTSESERWFHVLQTIFCQENAIQNFWISAASPIIRFVCFIRSFAQTTIRGNYR